MSRARGGGPGDLGQLERTAAALAGKPTDPLARIGAEVARYSAAGPIPLRFEVEARADGGATIIAVASVIDAEVYRATGAMVPTETRSRIGVALDADAATVRRAVTAIAGTAIDHEGREWLVCDGVLVDDPHAHDRRAS